MYLTFYFILFNNSIFVNNSSTRRRCAVEKDFTPCSQESRGSRDILENIFWYSSITSFAALSFILKVFVL